MRDNKFKIIYTQYWEKLYAFCFKMTHDEHLSQNIVQDVFTDLWERINDLQILSIESYLFRAVKNQVFKEYRKKQFDTTTIDTEFEDYLIENLTAIDTELVDKLYNLLDKLPAKRKEILMMNKLDEMDIDQIANKLNLSKQTVKNQITSGLKQLKVHAGEIILMFLFIDSL
ncbi:RNA polymerase ECF-type sigma factor [Arcticibacter svalbardensis MN12-7]|uniref:RNA polymerase ECF-type sigma factor n=1 Tax=Arcticibacter svalbardensis MN12-7 TaxID=1150600 RepID=R9GQ57_9SPHI|nr:sigma-70 family RNA polymerase sigma factor [Arcticibacter svalbardensis]EOR93853.1 RNA polymerase ECF-type sigma factor [Arcticibacter svalbardensis MN12-7]